MDPKEQKTTEKKPVENAAEPEEKELCPDELVNVGGSGNPFGELPHVPNHGYNEGDIKDRI